jgi:hypothetical protein
VGCLDIAFAEIKMVEVVTQSVVAVNGVESSIIHQNNQSILLMKNQHLITLIPEADKLQKWLEALRPYVIQTAIEEKYSLLKMLGEGTYGKVCLAEELAGAKQMKKQPSFSNEEMNFNLIVDEQMEKAED